LLEEQANAFLFGERGKFAPKGVLEGEAGALNQFFYGYKADDPPEKQSSPPLKSKITGISLKRGQRVRLETPGGGGFGRASERPLEKLNYDLEQGYITETKND
jgi:N-methylhydantoinase B